MDVAFPRSLLGLALAANWADPSEQPIVRREAIARISEAIWDHPLAMAGEGRLCSALNALKRTDGVELLVKTGAEGVYCAALPGLGLGVALKAEDGATRASEAALMAVLIAWVCSTWFGLRPVKKLTAFVIRQSRAGMARRLGPSTQCSDVKPAGPHPWCC